MDKSLELCTVFGFIFLITGCSLFFPNESLMQGQNGYSDDDSLYQNSTTSYPSSCYIGGTSLSNNTANIGYGHQHKITSNEKYRLVLPHTAQQSKHQHEIQTNPKQVEGQTQASTRQTNGDAAKLESEEKQQQFLRNQQQMQSNYQQQQQIIQATEQQRAKTENLNRQVQFETTKNFIEEKQQEFLHNQQQMQNNYQQQQRQNEYASEVAHKVQETNYQIESNIRKAEYEIAKKQQEGKKREEEEQQAIKNQVHQIQMQQAIQNQGFHFPGR